MNLSSPTFAHFDHDGDAAAMILNARRMAGLSQRQLAERAEVAQYQVSRYEARKSQPSYAMVMRLIEAAGISLRTHLVPDDGHDRSLVGRLVGGAE